MSQKSLVRPSVGIAVFVAREGKFLFQKRKGSHGAGSWSTPGGYLEFGESFEACAAREVYEETNMRIKNIRIAAVTNDFFKEENKHFVTVWLWSEWQEGESMITEPKKCVEQRWVDFDSLPEPLFEPWKQLFKNEAFENIKRWL